MNVFLLYTTEPESRQNWCYGSVSVFKLSVQPGVELLVPLQHHQIHLVALSSLLEQQLLFFVEASKILFVLGQFVQLYLILYLFSLQKLSILRYHRQIFDHLILSFQEYYQQSHGFLILI